MSFYPQETIVTLYDNALTSCHQIRQIHSFLLPALKFPPDLFLSSVGLLEEYVCLIRDRLKIAYQKCSMLLKAYAREYTTYLDFYNLNVTEYIQ